MSKPSRFPTSSEKTKKEGGEKKKRKNSRGLDNGEMAVTACVNMMT